MPKNSYSFRQKLQLAFWLLRTKLLSPKARLIRFPLDLRGGEFVDLGRNLTTGVGCRIEAFSTNGNRDKKIIFGNNVQINDYVHISAMEKVIIGDNTLMASHIYISDSSHGYYKGSEKDTPPTVPPIDRPYHTAPVTIGANAWLGEGVFIMPGVTIGEGCIVGAHSVVCGDLPDYTIAAGSPAKVIKKYNFEIKRWEKTDS